MPLGHSLLADSVTPLLAVSVLLAQYPLLADSGEFFPVPWTLGDFVHPKALLHHIWDTFGQMAISKCSSVVFVENKT